MSDDDAPKRPPRASWEPAEPEPVPVTPAVPSVIVADEIVRADDDPLKPLASSSPTSPPPRGKEDHDDDDDDHDSDDDPRTRRKWSRKTIVVSALSVTFGLGIAALVVLGSANKGRYLIVCEPEQVIARQGRGFPPWGTRGIDDDAKWKPIKIPPQAECRESETDDEAELSMWYLKMLHARADAQLRSQSHELAKVNEAAAMLEQALLHTRAPERADWRKRIEQLLGDVTYWRASAKVYETATALEAIAKQFDAAAAQSETSRAGASLWAAYLRKLSEDVRSGPTGAIPTTQPSTTPPVVAAPPGVALPVETGSGSGSASTVVPVDAGPPSGGVLL